MCSTKGKNKGKYWMSVYKGKPAPRRIIRGPLWRHLVYNHQITWQVLIMRTRSTELSVLAVSRAGAGDAAGEGFDPSSQDSSRLILMTGLRVQHKPIPAYGHTGMTRGCDSQWLEHLISWSRGGPRDPFFTLVLEGRICHLRPSNTKVTTCY